jgi:redox-sensitive bicupin YhaK (pirin superfamily)
MEKIVYPANERGSADFGWLNAKYSFSFANFYDAKKVHFGLLRVLNDDIVEPGQGFGKHPHDNMEIVTIPLKGELAHKDSAGHEEVIRPNEVQIMSAGSGILHSEYNHSKEDIVNLLQIWIFPKEKNIQPRYDQKYFDPLERENKWQLLVSPNKNNGSLWINQNAYFSRTSLQEDAKLDYIFHEEGNGIYLFLIQGHIKINEENLQHRDAVAISDTDKAEIEAQKKSDILVIEIPIN